MKVVFIINPKAGKRNKVADIVESIKSVSVKLKADAEIYYTKAVGDATRFVENYCEKHGKARFIACGGDGTLSEVLNGAINCSDAEIGVLPYGTGNDFCRNFKTDCDFKNIEHQILGESVKCDAIKYTTFSEEKEVSGYSVNMMNIGFDCKVADTTNAIKKKFSAVGSVAYFLSILITLIRKKTTNLKIELDGNAVWDGEVLLTCIANGSYCGGGINSNPTASVSDGFISVNIIKNVTRRKFISLLPHYMKGTFLKLRDIEKIILTKKCKKVSVTPYEKKIRMCNDGELTDAYKTEFEVVHNAFSFVIPTNYKLSEVTVK